MLHKTLALAIFMLMPASMVLAQQKVGYVDTQYILGKLPEYATAQQQVDRLAQERQAELDKRQRTVDEQFKEYQARELLYTNDERQRRREEIMRSEEEVERMRTQYFGPEGEIFTQQQNLLKPIQERVLQAVEQVATEEGYDYVLDKSGDLVFMFAREQYNLSDKVLQELGVDPERAGRGQ